VVSDLRWANASLATLEAARAALAGDAAAAADLYARAIAKWRPLHSDLDLGFALLEYAELGQPEDEGARTAAAEARRIFDRLGAATLNARVDLAVARQPPSSAATRRPGPEPAHTALDSRTTIGT
jgi:hypothetical protein